MSRQRPARPPLTKAGQLKLLERGFAQGRAAAPDPSVMTGAAVDPTGVVDAGEPAAPPARARTSARPAPAPQAAPTGAEGPASATSAPPGTDAPAPTTPGTDAPAPTTPGTAAPTPTAAPEPASDQVQPPAVVDGAPTRALAGPPPAAEEMVRKSLNVAPAVFRACETWLRVRRETMRRPALSWLLDAALADLPNDVAELRALAAELPGWVLEERPQQVTVLIRHGTAARVEDAQFELAQLRRRDTPLWHALSAAVARQLRAEQIPVDLTRP